MLPDERIIKNINHSFYPMMIKDTEVEFYKLTEQFQIQSLPALIVAPRDGKNKELIIEGNISTADLLEKLKEIIARQCSAV